MTDKLRYQTYTNQLDGAYRTNFDKIEAYFISAIQYKKTRAIYLSEILDLLLHAQRDGRPVERVIGRHPQEFCRNFIKAAYPCVELRTALQDIRWVGGLAMMLALLSGALDLAFDAQNPLMGKSDCFFLLLFLFASVTGRLSSMVLRTLLFRVQKFTLRSIQLIGLLEGILFCAVIYGGAFWMHLTLSIIVPNGVLLLCGTICMLLAAVVLRCLPGIYRA